MSWKYLSISTYFLNSMNCMSVYLLYNLKRIKVNKRIKNKQTYFYYSIFIYISHFSWYYNHFLCQLKQISSTKLFAIENCFFFFFFAIISYTKCTKIISFIFKIHYILYNKFIIHHTLLYIQTWMNCFKKNNNNMDINNIPYRCPYISPNHHESHTKIIIIIIYSNWMYNFP